MFQYAAGRALAIRNGSALKLDLRGFERYSLHQGYQLSKVFSIDVAAATESEIRTVLGWQRHRVARRIVQAEWLMSFGIARYLREPRNYCWSTFARLRGPAYLEGYWQSECYFEPIRDQIRSDFKYCRPIDRGNAVLAEQMERGMSVSLHVRRGDYVTNTRAAQRHGTCDLEYYDRAIRFIADRFERAEFYAFSDDMAWVRKNLGALGVPITYVDHNDDDASYNDMRLMSCCKHNIVANSSFSWWGGWLNRNEKKIVIAPKRWFADGVRQAAATNICPPSWVRL